MHPPPAQVLSYLPLHPTLGSLTQGHLPICQVHNPYLFAHLDYHSLLLFLLRMVVPVLLWGMARPIRPPHCNYLKSFMFSISLSTSFLTIVPFRIRRQGRGLVWGVRLDVDFVSLSVIIFQLGSLVSFRRSILHFSGIDDLTTLVSLNSAKLSHGFLFLLLSVSHVNFQASYPRLNSIPTKSLFDLLHCDVWGPSRVTSILGIHYYIIFVDDFSRVSRVYLLKYRTDVLPSIHQFRQEISTKYSKTPKILCIDNALEFF